MNARSLALSLLLVAGLVPSHVLGQAVSTDCHTEQQAKFEKQRKFLTDKDLTLHPQLVKAAERSKQLVAEANRMNQKWKEDIQSARDEALKNKVQTNTAKPQAGSTSPKDVHAYLDSLVDGLRQASVEMIKSTMARPEADRPNAATTILQTTLDNEEAIFLRERMRAGVSREYRDQVVGEAIQSAEKDLHLFPSHIAQKLQGTKVWADVAVAYAAADAIRRTGLVPEKFELVVGVGQTPFDDAGRVFANIAGDGVVAAMAIPHVGDNWGGYPEAVDLRRQMGPETRKGTSAGGSIGLVHLGKVMQSQDIAKQYIVPVPQVTTDKEINTFVTQAAHAIRETATKIKQQLDLGLDWIENPQTGGATPAASPSPVSAPASRGSGAKQ